MDQPNAATIHTSISIDGGDVADIHIRMCSPTQVGFVAVYVQPRGPIPGYWFTSLDSKEAERAYWLAGAVLGYNERQAVLA